MINDNLLISKEAYSNSRTYTAKMVLRDKKNQRITEEPLFFF